MNTFNLKFACACNFNFNTNIYLYISNTYYICLSGPSVKKLAIDSKPQ